MLQRIPRLPQHEAKAARIPEPYQRAVFQDELEMVVRRDWSGLVRDEQASRHSQVNNERARAAVDQQIFAAAGERPDGGAGDDPGQQPRDAETKAAVANNGSPDALADHKPFEAASRGLNFGEFRHPKTGDRLPVTGDS